MLLDLNAAALVACFGLACALSGGSVSGVRRLVLAVFPSAMMVSLLVGAVDILSDLANPADLLPTVGQALIPIAYLSLGYFLFSLYPATDAASSTANDRQHPIAGATLGLLVIGVSCSAGSALVSFVSFGAFLYFGLSISILLLVSRWQTSTKQISLIIEKLPFFGVAPLFASLILMLINFSDPTAIGPVMAFGLLSCLYCLVTSILLTLAFPQHASRATPIQHLGLFCVFFMFMNFKFDVLLHLLQAH